MQLTQGILTESPQGEKRCSKCGEVKPLHTFVGYSRKAISKKGNTCKQCHASYARAKKHIYSQRPKLPITQKRCSGCHEVKPVSDFFKHSVSKDGYDTRCKECKRIYLTAWKQSVKNDPIRLAAQQERARKHNLRIMYGLTTEDYTRMYQVQGGVCAICGRPETTPNQHKVRPLFVDHCHKTDKVRGLLCNGCNSALGHFEDDIERLKNAIAYIESYSLLHSEETEQC